MIIVNKSLKFSYKIIIFKQKKLKKDLHFKFEFDIIFNACRYSITAIMWPCHG